MTLKFPMIGADLRGPVAAAGLLVLLGACDVNTPGGTLMEWGVNLPVVAFQVDGITYRAQDRQDVELPDYAEDKSRYRVPIGDRGEISLYCDTIQECRAMVRQTGYHDKQVNPPKPPAKPAEPKLKQGE
jgi:hypothetical protein